MVHQCEVLQNWENGYFFLPHFISGQFGDDVMMTDDVLTDVYGISANYVSCTCLTGPINTHEMASWLPLGFSGGSVYHR